MVDPRASESSGRPHIREEGQAPARAVILAGGMGTRLAPFTSVLPKPLMPIGDRAILELVVDQLAAHGLREITFCVGYLAHLIRAVFDATSNRSVSIEYVLEERALGTAGPLQLVSDLDDTFLVMNGDVLTTIDYGDLIRHHRAAGNTVTIAAHQRTIKVDYGVLELDGGLGDCRPVHGYIEKPEMESKVSMGIYVVEPRALDYVPRGEFFDFPDLVLALLAAGEPVGAYVFDGLWFDIGRVDDYQLANTAWLDMETGSRIPEYGTRG